MIKRIPWSVEVDVRLTHQAGRDCVPWLREQVIAGVAKLWHCVDGKHEAYIITRMCLTPPELVICYAEGTGLHRFAPEFIAAARAKGVPMRAHTTSQFMVRYARRFGFELQEYVMRTKVAA